MPADRFESWKHRPPASAKEQVTADLLKQVGEAETLSPQAMARVERRLRSARPRPSWLGNLGLATAAVGGLAVALIAVVMVRRGGTPNGSLRSSTDQISAGAKLEDRTLALNDVPPPPAAEPEPSQPATERQRSGPSDAKTAAKKVSRPVAGSLGAAGSTTADKAEFAAAPPPGGAGLRAGAARSLAAGAPAAADRAEFAAAPPPGGAGGPAGAAQSLPSGAALDLNSQLDAASCRAALPRFSATLERDNGDVEQALIGRASCRLLLGQREQGLADLHDYLTRFPLGRFVARARALLSGADKD